MPHLFVNLFVVGFEPKHFTSFLKLLIFDDLTFNASVTSRLRRHKNVLRVVRVAQLNMLRWLLR